MKQTTFALLGVVLFSLFWVNWFWRDVSLNESDGFRQRLTHDDDTDSDDHPPSEPSPTNRGGRSGSTKNTKHNDHGGSQPTTTRGKKDDDTDTELDPISDGSLGGKFMQPVVSGGGCRIPKVPAPGVAKRKKRGHSRGTKDINPCHVFERDNPKERAQFFTSGPKRCQWFRDWQDRQTKNGGGGGLGNESKELIATHLTPEATLYPVVCNAGNKRQWRPGKCADDNAWLLPWMAARPNSDWTLVDVGANKGYVISGWLDALQENSPFGPYNLAASIYGKFGPTMQQGLASLCGGCCECVDRPPELPTDFRARSARIHAFEPSVANYRWLTEFFRMNRTRSIILEESSSSSLGTVAASASYKTKVDVLIRNAAVSASRSKLYFPDNAFGIETGKVKSQPMPGYVPVDILTLEEELKGKSILRDSSQKSNRKNTDEDPLAGEECLDVLSTDAEGFDQDVARGAEWFLSQGRVGVYQFEMYREDDYQAVFERLKRWGYVCYFATASRRPPKNQPAGGGTTPDGAPAGPRKRTRKLPEVPKVVRITDCWEPEYSGYIGWVNGLCYNSRIPALQKIFNLLSQHPHKGGSGNCDSKQLQRNYARYFMRKYVDAHVTAEKVESMV